MKFVLMYSGALCLFPLLQNPPSTQDEKPVKVTLTLRKDNGEYGNSAYSFRYESQDKAVHKNYVDLVYNGCGLTHVNAHANMRSRIVDLGKMDLSKVSEAPKEGWRKDCVLPMEKHAYVLKIDDGEQPFTVKFVITKIGKESLEIEWAPLGKRPKFKSLDGRGAAGTMGQCGGKHDEE